MIPLRPDAYRPDGFHYRVLGGAGQEELSAEYRKHVNDMVRQQNRTDAANFVIGYLNHALSKGIAGQNRDTREYAKELVDAGFGAYISLCRGLDDLE